MFFERDRPDPPSASLPKILNVRYRSSDTWVYSVFEEIQLLRKRLWCRWAGYYRQCGSDRTTYAVRYKGCSQTTRGMLERVKTAVLIIHRSMIIFRNCFLDPAETMKRNKKKTAQSYTMSRSEVCAYFGGLMTSFLYEDIYGRVRSGTLHRSC